MIPINNINTYIKGLNKSIEDKLWFKQFLNIPSFQNNTVIIDYGCGDGTLIKTLAPIFPNIEFIGIDSNSKMLELARSNSNLYCYYDSSFKNNYVNKQKILIMSSVFHEIMSYSNFGLFYNSFINFLKPDYIFFRDMMPSESIYRYSNSEDIKKVMLHIDNEVFQKLPHDKCKLLEDNLGDTKIQKFILNYLFKYRYIENWERELKENYMPTCMENIKDFFPDYNIIYSKHYVLPWLKQKVKEDFGINLVDNTHVNLIFKRYNIVDNI